MAPQLYWCSQRRCLCEGSVAPQLWAFAEEVSVRVSHKKCLTRVSSKSVLQECHVRIVLQECHIRSVK